MAPVEELALLEFDRSNKGASKQRRDQINAEIATMRDLLPLPESSRQRLSQLQIMSLTCVYIRKCNVLQKLFRTKVQDNILPDSLDFFQAMTGFLLVTTREGKLLYISENVTDYLGHSMVDMKTQGDSLYDIVDKRDHGTVQAQLLHNGPQQDKDSCMDVSFFCRMNMSRTLKRQSGFGDVKVMHVRGHFLQICSTEPICPSESQCVFMATCSPLITPEVKENLVQNNTMVFKTVHKLDMTFLEVTKNGEYHLGCSNEELNNKSWYSMLHPEDIHEAKDKHVQLIRSNHEIGCMFTVRMLRLDGTCFWVNVVMNVRQASLSQNEEPLIVCINQVIDSHEAYQIKVQGHMFSLYPNRTPEIWGNHLPAVSPPSQDHMSGQWIQQSGPNSVPGYTTNISSYVPHGGRPDLYPATCSTLVSSSRLSKPAVGYPLSNPSSFVQLDQLKAMLKRKIQGPQSATSCKPTKHAKMSWDIDGSSAGCGYTETDHSIYQMEHYNQIAVSSHVDCQNQMIQVMQPENYRFGLMTSSKMSLKQLACQGVSKMNTMISEQVVPDLNVPESFLTPDPSPISSPQPSYSFVKTEVMDPEEKVHQGKPTVSILQALEKLAALPQAGMTGEKVPVAKRKELPIFDAFDIDNFFETLNPGELEAKTSIKMEVQLKHPIKMEIPDEQVENNSNFAALKEERSSPTISYHSPTIAPNIKHPLHKLKTQSLVPDHYIPAIPNSHMRLPSLSPAVDSSAQEQSLEACEYKKDMLVSSTMASSPKSMTSQESIDDLLSYFSDDGMDSSPNHLNPQRSSAMKTLKEADMEKRFYYKSFYAEKPDCKKPQPIISQHMSEELSPQSSTSSLYEEDDLIVDSPTFPLDMALSVLDNQSEIVAKQQNGDIKDHNVLGLSDELKLDFIIPSWGPVQGSLDLIKHGQ
uniref:BHLH domain-containing protein n=1 Tax=Arion vulgaris TaxID=1028688 RepID=A0A0B7A972_9EUPU